MRHALIAWFKSLLSRLWPGAGNRGGAALDPELCDVFFAELADVTSSLRTAAAAWRASPRDPEALKAVRRGFHTLKGSAPLVGATAIGEFCATVEQLLIRLGESPAKITPGAIELIDRAVALLPAFAAASRDGRPVPPEARAIATSATRIA